MRRSFTWFSLLTMLRKGGKPSWVQTHGGRIIHVVCLVFDFCTSYKIVIFYYKTDCRKWHTFLKNFSHFTENPVNVRNMKWQITYNNNSSFHYTNTFIQPCYSWALAAVQHPCGRMRNPDRRSLLNKISSSRPRLSALATNTHTHT